MDKERESAFSGFMHGLAAEDVDAANIKTVDDMAGQTLVTTSLPEEDFGAAREIGDNFGFKPAGTRGEDDRTGEDRFAFEPRF